MTKEATLKIYDQIIDKYSMSKNFTHEDIIKTHGFEVTSFKNYLINELSKLGNNDEGEFVEAALDIILNLGTPENWITILCNLLIVPNHHSHEDIIRDIQDSKNPDCIPFIKKAIELKPNLDHLEYDDYGSFYKKCLWALYDIGTQESYELIKAFTKSDIPELKEEAIYRLSKYQRETT